MILDDLRTHITEHCLDEKQADVLMQKVDAISQMMNRLLQLRAQSKVMKILPFVLTEYFMFIFLKTRVKLVKQRVFHGIYHNNLMIYIDH